MILNLEVKAMDKTFNNKTKSVVSLTDDMDLSDRSNGLDQDTDKTFNEFHPGEKGFPVFLFLVGAFFAYQAFLMYQKAPGASSYAAVPLFVSLLIMIFSGLIIVFDMKSDSANSNVPFLQKITQSLTYMFPKDVMIMMLLILSYCIALLFNVGFYIITPVFLWLSMCYLMRKHFIKNILWTGLSLIFIFAVFSFAFKVVLP